MNDIVYRIKDRELIKYIYRNLSYSELNDISIIERYLIEIIKNNSIACNSMGLYCLHNMLIRDCKIPENIQIKVGMEDKSINLNFINNKMGVIK